MDLWRVPKQMWIPADTQCPKATMEAHQYLGSEKRRAGHGESGPVLLFFKVRRRTSEAKVHREVLAFRCALSGSSVVHIAAKDTRVSVTVSIMLSLNIILMCSDQDIT